MANPAKPKASPKKAIHGSPMKKSVEGSKKIQTIIDTLREKGAKGLYIGAEMPDVFKDRTPFDTFGLNVITGGGIPDNSITEIEGPPATFKTTAGGCIKQRQRMLGRKCVSVWLATENLPDKNWMRQLGTKIPYSDIEIARFKELGVTGESLEFLVNEQEEGGMFVLLSGQVEDSIDVSRKLLSTGDVSILVFDSIGAVSANAEREAESVGDSQVAANTRVVSKTTRLMQAEANVLTNEGAKTAVIYINQVRVKIGGFSPNPSVIPMDIPGGWTLKHGKVLQVKTKVIGTIKEGEKVWAKEIAFKIEKSKICIPHRTCNSTFVLRSDNPARLPIGPDTSTEAFHLALDCEVITYVGREWVYAGTVLELNGKPAAKNDIPLVLRADAQMLEAVKADVLKYNQRLEIKGIG